MDTNTPSRSTKCCGGEVNMGSIYDKQLYKLPLICHVISLEALGKRD